VGEQDDRLGRGGDPLGDERADAITSCLVQQDIASARVGELGGEPANAWSAAGVPGRPHERPG